VRDAQSLGARLVAEPIDGGFGLAARIADLQAATFGVVER
jgi:hypothetical protein